MNTEESERDYGFDFSNYPKTEIKLTIYKYEITEVIEQ